jgi:hypothetical protein
MRRTVSASLAVGVVCAMGAFACGCLDRKVEAEQPNLNTQVGIFVRTEAITKIDLLFLIDNSASMGDKQNYLISAVPDLVSRLVQPNCVDPTNPDLIVVQSDPTGACPAGSIIEFPPVHDLHLGVVTSALGTRGGDACDPTAMSSSNASLPAHNDDKGELINRGGDDEHAVADMTSSNFLAWFPGVVANAGVDAGVTPTVTDATTLENDFKDLVNGVHQAGCGIESQLEAWYRFLIQPDPYASIEVTGANTDWTDNGSAGWSGVDTTILRQRKDFLRPDSLVAIVDLTDENDSEVDVRSLAQRAYNLMYNGRPTYRGTSACAADPGSSSCTSCLLMPSDPACAQPTYTAFNDWGFDANLRHVHMKAKYGLDFQFPLSRYTNGLSSTTVPDRNGEYPTMNGSTSAFYVGQNDCTNPLFAAQLPTGDDADVGSLCKLAVGTRSASDIFFAHIGGVPSALLHYVPNDSKASTLTSDDWTKILGKDPDNYDYTGIDPHMIESYQPRAGLADPNGPDNADPVNGREWVTDQNGTNAVPGGKSQVNVDLEYACTFAIEPPRDCSLAANKSACDCPSSGTWPHADTPPLCGDGVTNAQTMQVAAKSYPTIREIELAHMMGGQGVLSSICPIHPQMQGANDPLYGYRPAVAAIVNRLKSELGAQCLPQPLATKGGAVPCDVLEALPTAGDTCGAHGLTDASANAAQAFRTQLQAAAGDAGGATDLSNNAVCVAPLLDVPDGGSCKDSKLPGWCYLTGPAAGLCPQSIELSPAATVSGAQVSLQCIEQAAGTSTE